MENKKINVFFYLVVIFFLATNVILIKEFTSKRVSDYRDFKTIVTHIVIQKNNKIRFLFSQLVAKQKENEDLRNTLAETRNALEGLSKKLAQPTPIAAQTTVAVPAGVPVALPATK